MLGKEGGAGYIFFIVILFYTYITLYIDSELPMNPGSGKTVCVGGDWWWCVSLFSVLLWSKPGPRPWTSTGTKPNNNNPHLIFHRWGGPRALKFCMHAVLSYQKNKNAALNKFRIPPSPPTMIHLGVNFTLLLEGCS